MKLMFTVMSGSNHIGGFNNKLQRRKQLKMKRRKLSQLRRTRLLMLERKKEKRKEGQLKETLQVLVLLKQRKKKPTLRELSQQLLQPNQLLFQSFILSHLNSMDQLESQKKCSQNLKHTETVVAFHLNSAAHNNELRHTRKKPVSVTVCLLNSVDPVVNQQVIKDKLKKTTSLWFIREQRLIAVDFLPNSAGKLTLKPKISPLMMLPP